MGIRCSQTIFTESSVVKDNRQNILMINFAIRRGKWAVSFSYVYFLSPVQNDSTRVLNILCFGSGAGNVIYESFPRTLRKPWGPTGITLAKQYCNIIVFFKVCFCLRPHKHDKPVFSKGCWEHSVIGHWPTKIFSCPTKFQLWSEVMSGQFFFFFFFNRKSFYGKDE